MVERSSKPSAIPISPSVPAPLATVSDDNSRVVASLPTGDCVEILLHGATVISWKSADGHENLFLSSKSALDGSRAVRGGIPVVFPVRPEPLSHDMPATAHSFQSPSYFSPNLPPLVSIKPRANSVQLFGPASSSHPATAKLPQHGFARSTRWEYLGKSSSESSSLPGTGGDASVTLDFGLSDAMLDETARAPWPHAFGLEYSVTLASGELTTSLRVQNTGAEPWEFQTLLHTYFEVEVRFHGLYQQAMVGAGMPKRGHRLSPCSTNHLALIK